MNGVRENDIDKLENGSNHISNEQQLRNVLTNTMSISPELFVSTSHITLSQHIMTAMPQY